MLSKKETHLSGLGHRTHIILVLLILLFGFLVRSWNIDAVPAGIYPDEAQNGYDAYLAQSSHTYHWFYPDNNGREGLYVNLIAFSFKLFGITLFSFKLASILAGTLTILGTYLLARELFWRWKNGIYLSLITALLIASSFWHILFSRIGFRAILLPLILTFSFWLLLRGLRLIKEHRRHFSTFLISGLIFGVGLHTYIAFRIAPAILLIFFITLLLSRRFSFRQLWQPSIIFFVGAILSAAPLLWTFSTHPEFLTSRSSDVSLFSSANNGGDILGTLGTTLGLSLAKFNFWGDQNWRHGYPPYPTLEPIVGIFFLIGICTSLFASGRFFFLSLWSRIRRNVAIPSSQTWPSVHILLLAWFLLMLAPEFLTVEGLPHALRSIGTLPVVYLFASIGIGTIWHIFENHRLLFREFFVPFLVIILIYIALFGMIKYHVFWAQKPEMAHAFNKNLTDIAYAVKKAPPESVKIVIAGPLERLPIMLLNTSTPHITVLYPHEVPTFSPPTSPYIIYMTDCSQNSIANLPKYFNKLPFTRYTSSLGSYYCTLSSS